MAQNFRQFMAPDFEAQAPMQFDQPQLEWMPWEQNNDVGNVGTIVDQLKKRQQKPPMTGAIGGAMGDAKGGMKGGGGSL